MNYQKKQTSIYIGLNDAETRTQKYDTEKYLSILKNVCYHYKLPFSVHEISGGYFHEDGQYVEEVALCVTMLDAPENTVMEIAKDLCAFFQQESVMVTHSPCSVVFVKENLPEPS